MKILMQQLYKLPMIGKSLQNAMKLEEEARKKVVDDSKKASRLWKLGSRMYEQVTSTVASWR